MISVVLLSLSDPDPKILPLRLTDYLIVPPNHKLIMKFWMTFKSHPDLAQAHKCEVKLVFYLPRDHYQHERILHLLHKQLKVYILLCLRMPSLPVICD